MGLGPLSVQCGGPLTNSKALKQKDLVSGYLATVLVKLEYDVLDCLCQKFLDNVGRVSSRAQARPVGAKETKGLKKECLQKEPDPRGFEV